MREEYIAYTKSPSRGRIKTDRRRLRALAAGSNECGRGMLVMVLMVVVMLVMVLMVVVMLVMVLTVVVQEGGEQEEEEEGGDGRGGTVEAIGGERPFGWGCLRSADVQHYVQMERARLIAPAEGVRPPRCRALQGRVREGEGG